MRPLEIALVGALWVALAAWWVGWRPAGLRLWPIALAVVAAAQLTLEGYRWQLAPAYALAAVTGLAAVFARPRAAPKAGRQPLAARAARWAGAGAALSAGLFIAGLPLVFPVPQLPEPSGEYAIGTLSFDWVDPGRAEAYTADPDDQREIMVQVWYPADPPAAAAARAPWVERLDVAGPAIARYLKLPGFILDHTALIRTHAYLEAPLAAAEARYPVVIYSHGWNGFRTVNLDEIEALASHGYIVAAVDHTYGAMFTTFPDGRVALNKPDALPRDNAAEAEAQPIREQLINTYARDLRFVLDQFERLNAGELDARFAGRLDLEHIGLFGHSTGAGAVVLACRQDARCQAGLALDAWLVPVPDADLEAGLDQPFFFLWSQFWVSKNNPAHFELLRPNLRGGYQTATLQGTRHYDFTLMPLFTPLAPALGWKGPLEGARVMRIVEDYLVAFFDQTLKGQPNPLWEGPAAAYPEVVYAPR